MCNRPIKPINSQRGTALTMSLVFLVLLTLIGITAMNTSVLEEKMAGNIKDQYMAFQAAESALKNAETDAFTNVSNATLFTPSCDNGFCLSPTSGAFIWDTVDWSAASTTSRGYGQYTSATALPGLAEQPRYIIEDIPNPTTPASGESLTDPAKRGAQGNEYFRITARGVGSTTSSQVVLQSTFRK